MNLLILIPSSNRGGAEEYAFLIGAEARQRGWSVQAAMPGADSMRSLRSDFEARGVRCHDLDIDDGAGRTGLARQWRCFRNTRSLLRRLRPDVVQIEIPYPHRGFGCLLAMAAESVPTNAVFHLAPFPVPLGLGRRTLLRRARRLGQIWTAVSASNRAALCEMFGLSEDEIRVVYNGVEGAAAGRSPDRMVRIESRRSFCRELGGDPTANVFLSVGRLDEQKGFRDLVEGAAKIVPGRPDTAFLIAGDGELQGELAGRVNHHGLTRHVFLLGNRRDVPDLMRMADAFIFPSHYEGFSLALLEAMACGLPILAARASSIPEAVTDGLHARLFPVGNPDALAETVLWALSHQAGMEELAVRAKERAGEFSRERMIRETFEIFGELIAPRNG